jgi:hypothetical protein
VGVLIEKEVGGKDAFFGLKSAMFHVRKVLVHPECAVEMTTFSERR